jgi:hypothetical protein
MRSSARPATGWKTLFLGVSDHLKELAAKQWPLELDGSGPDVHVSLHRLFNALPVPADILLLDTNDVDLPLKQGPFATAIRYDFSKPNKHGVRFHGIVPLAKADAHAQLIESALGIDTDALRPLKDLTLTYLWDAPRLTHVVPYDARTRVSDYASDLAGHISSPSQLSGMFFPRIDFNAKYNLSPDPPLKDEQLLTIDPLSACFVKTSHGGPETLSELHSSIAHIQLIPQVPEDVRRTFHRAKRLYVYGYLEYGFFTISNHYALTALDAALHARWSATLPASVSLTWKNEQTGKLEQQTMAAPSHIKIRDFCKRAGWRVSAVRVHGKPFPYSGNLVIAELAERKIITNWQRKMIQEVDVEIRNSLAHVKSAPVDTLSPHLLELAAETINRLFDSLPVSAKPARP